MDADEIMSLLALNVPGSANPWAIALSVPGRFARVADPLDHDPLLGRSLLARSTGQLSGANDLQGDPLAIFRLSNGIECLLSLQEFRFAVRGRRTPSHTDT